MSSYIYIYFQRLRGFSRLTVWQETLTHLIVECVWAAPKRDSNAEREGLALKSYAAGPVFHEVELVTTLC
jgi:hypothetical protein